MKTVKLKLGDLIVIFILVSFFLITRNDITLDNIYYGIIIIGFCMLIKEFSINIWLRNK